MFMAFGRQGNETAIENQNEIDNEYWAKEYIDFIPKLEIVRFVDGQDEAIVRVELLERSEKRIHPLKI